MNELRLIGYFFKRGCKGNWKIEWSRAIEIIEDSVNVPLSHKTHLTCMIQCDFMGCIDYDNQVDCILDNWVNDCIADYITMYKTRKFVISRPPPLDPCEKFPLM